MLDALSRPRRSDVGYARKDTDSEDPSMLSEGALLNLTLVGDGIVSSVYTYSLSIGSEGTNFPLQIDTGSSDSWVVSPSCSTDACSTFSGPKFDPSGSSDARDTGETFEIQYLEGYVSGPIFWDTFDFGPYALSSQAFGVVNVVQDEVLSTGYSGILALAFPLNSKIAQVIHPTNGNSPDGAPMISNLFGLGNYGPREHFVSILLERPGILRIPSLLGVGRHPAKILPSIASTPPGSSWRTSLTFNKVVEYEAGALFWSTSVTGLTAYVNGSAVPIDVGTSDADPNAVHPVGVLDTGIPFIFASAGIVNAFYGAYGIGPGSDGSYYVPCTTPVNMTISLNDQIFPIHPLDVTYVSKDVQDSRYCVGAVQASASLVNADFIFGAAFLRNVYTVLSYDRKGSEEYSNLTISDSDPAIALLSVTNITQALEEFDTVRVDHQPLPSSSSLPTPGTSTDGHGGSGGKHGLGKLWILIGILLALGFVSGAFITRCLVRRRRSLKRVTKDVDDTRDGSSTRRPRPHTGIPIALTSLGSYGDKSTSRFSKTSNGDELDEETFHSKRPFAGGWHRHSGASFMSSSSGTGTRVGDGTEPTNDFGELSLSLSTVDELGDDRQPRDGLGTLGPNGARSTRAARSRSRGPRGSVHDAVYPTDAHPVSLTTDASLLTNIPTLEEITPEALSSSRYPTFTRHSPSPVAAPSSLASRRQSLLSPQSVHETAPIPHPLSNTLHEDVEDQGILHHRVHNADADPVTPSSLRPAF